MGGKVLIFAGMCYTFTLRLYGEIRMAPITRPASKKRRRPGGGRKATVNAIAPLSIRISPETRGALDAEAAVSGKNISRLAEALLSDGLRERRRREISDPVRALAFLIEGVALLSKSNAENGAICEWNTNPAVFETFRIAVDKLFERLRPPGEIDTSISGPLIGRSPEQQAEAIFRQIWAGLHSADALSLTQIDKLVADRGWRAMPKEAVAALSSGSYSAAAARKDLNIKMERET
jgi:hypothetical protein